MTVGYDIDTQTLEIRFKSGHVYRYAHVPEAVHQGLMTASSHGRYFHRHIKDHYPCIGPLT